MCILTGSPERVSNTQILAFRAKDGLHQVTVYANRVRLMRSTTYNECAMVLPFPAGGCEMIDTTDTPDLFQSLDGLFPRSYFGGRGGGFGGMDDARLEVKSCGSYDYSVAPTLSDLARLDPKLHIGDVTDLLRREYGGGFSFLVCAIRESAKYHPIAYRHALDLGGGLGSAKLFLPTLHEHGPALHGAAMWDHAIYTLDIESSPSPSTSERVVIPRAELDQAIGPALAKHVIASTHNEVCKTTITGDFPNADILLRV